MIIGKKKETQSKGVQIVFRSVDLETVKGREEGSRNLRIVSGAGSVTLYDMPETWPSGATAQDVDVHCSAYARSKGGFSPDKVESIWQDGKQVWPEKS